MLRSVIAVIFASWFTLTLLGQHPGGNHRSRELLSRLSSTIFMPNWAFFAPNPGIYDDHLFYRSREDNGFTPWKETATFRNGDGPTWLSPFYSGASRRSKGIIDIFSTLESLANTTLSREESDATQAGRQAIANYIVANADEVSPYTFEYEVMLVRSAGYAQDEDPVFYYRFTVRNGIADAPHQL